MSEPTEQATLDLHPRVVSLTPDEQSALENLWDQREGLKLAILELSKELGRAERAWQAAMYEAGRQHGIVPDGTWTLDVRRGVFTEHSDNGEAPSHD